MKVDMADYIRNLATFLFRSYNVNMAAVTLDIHTPDHIQLNIDRAIPCGLILNELLSNALKHAFPRVRSGQVKVELRRVDKNVDIVISDDGVGLPEHLDIHGLNSLGLKLVISLVDQLDGTIKLERSGGTRFHTTFAE
jgi:two-component sensor histidine kinase